jgi:hypothetical protein
MAYQLQGVFERGQAQDRVELALERSKIGQQSSTHKVFIVDVGTSQVGDLDQPRLILLAGSLDIDIFNSFVSALLVVHVGFDDRQGFAITHTVEGFEWSSVLSFRHEEDTAQEGRTSNSGILEKAIVLE